MTRHIGTITKAGTAAVMAAGLIGVPASAATGESAAAPTASAACRTLTGSPKGAPRADASVRFCRSGKRVSWQVHFYPRGTPIAVEGTFVRNGRIVARYKSGTYVSYRKTRRYARKGIDHAWFKVCRVRGARGFYACNVLR